MMSCDIRRRRKADGLRRTRRGEEENGPTPLLRPAVRNPMGHWSFLGRAPIADSSCRITAELHMPVIAPGGVEDWRGPLGKGGG